MRHLVVDRGQTVKDFILAVMVAGLFIAAVMWGLCAVSGGKK